ncbi:MAG: hypothetical protein L0H15_09910, partial [Nitrosospira sp.]|nr:hypothetical protein [Nitrosospira sp.]
KHGKTLSFLDARDAYLSGKAQLVLVECSLVRQSRELFDRDSGTTPSSMGEREFSEKLLKYLSSFSYNPGVKLLSKIKPTSEAFIDDPLKRAATLFEQNYLYISAAITHIKAISYYTAILDVFDYSTFSDDKDIDYKYRQELLTLTENVHKLILTRGADAIRCIEKARQLETSHSNKTLLIYDLTSRHNAHEMNITKLFDMLLRPETDGNYPVNEALFWQNSLWAHKLVATLCWAHYVKRKIEIKPEVYESHKNIPGYLPGILGVSGFSVRPAILLRWICARDLNRQHIDKKLVTINEKGCDVNKILKNLSNVQLTIAGKKIVDYLKLQKREDSKIPPILKNAYLISRYLYFAQESSRIISRKNLDLIFPRLPQLYFAQWKLLLNLISTMLVGRDEIIKHTGEQLDSVRDFSFLLQRALVAIDQDLAPEERIAPSHFDYEFIYLRLNESLESSKSLVDTTSRAHKSIFQHKYFCHDDHSDPDFRMDYTLAYMFTPRAQYVHEEIKKTHQELKQVLEEHPMP